MMSEDKALILSTNKNDKYYALTCWNLKQKSNKSVEFPLAFNIVDFMLFKQTEIVCVCEHLKDSSKLSYFKLPL